MIKLIKFYHSNQFNNNGKVPYWHHLVRVTFYLENALRESGEILPGSKLFDELLLAALGHDLYEDTKVTSQKIVDNYGESVHKYIDYMTNYEGDSDRLAYIQKIREAPEEVRFIKLADLIDNTTSVAYGIHDLGLEWVNTFFLPIISEMGENIHRTEFTIYPRTADILLHEFDVAFRLLKTSMKNWS